LVASPKNSRGDDLMMEAPSEVPDRQLRDLHIQLRREK